MSAQVDDIATLAGRDGVIDLRDASPQIVELVVDPVGPPSGAYAAFVKPAFDRIVAVVLLVLVLPVLVAVAVAVRASLGSSVLFRQERVGRGGRRFVVYKFRTMQPDRRTRQDRFDGDDRRATHKSADDPRLNNVGRFLRTWSLDELPQLFNVVRGDMSLVGPRPELVDIVARYAPWEHARHVVRPGLTGLWQIRARSMGPTHLFTHLDIEYVRGLSFGNDLRILLATLPAAMGAQKGW